MKRKKKSPITHPTADLQSKNQPVIWTLKPRLPWGEMDERNSSFLLRASTLTFPFPI